MFVKDLLKFSFCLTLEDFKAKLQVFDNRWREKRLKEFQMNYFSNKPMHITPAHPSS
jgi:hypothetical protein